MRIVGTTTLKLEDLVLAAGRLLLVGIFLHEGIYLVANLPAASAGMAAAGVPAFVLAGTILLQLGAGAAISIGWQARPAAAALGLFCIATALLFHTHLSQRNELLHFEKDLAIAGGMFVLMLRGAGSYALG